jgi:hypothetical protein
VTFDRFGKPIERAHNVCRAATRFHLELRSSESDPGSAGADPRPRAHLRAAMSGAQGGGQ